jgi:hypothetical protein
MTTQETQHERVARYLDGERVELSADERALADELRAGEGFLAADLDVRCTAAARRRAQRRLYAAVSARPRRSLRFVALAGSVAAAAAVVLLAVQVFWNPSLPDGMVVETVHVPTDVLMQSVESSSDLDLELELLAGQIEQAQAEPKLASGDDTQETAVDDLQEKIDRFWADDNKTDLLWPVRDSAG